MRRITIKGHILEIQPNGGTNFEVGYTKATELFKEYKNIIFNYLKELCPNVKIDFFDNLDNYYEWEDIEYAWSDYELECNCLLTSKEDFKKFLLQGTIIWGNRDLTDDNGWTSIINNVIKEYPIIWCKWSG